MYPNEIDIIGWINNTNSSSIGIVNTFWLSGCGASYGRGNPASNGSATAKTAAQLQSLASTLGYAYQ